MSKKEALYLDKMRTSNPISPLQEHSIDIQSKAASPSKVLEDLQVATLQSYSARKVMESDRLFEAAEEAIQNASISPTDKHVHVLLHVSALCRMMGGTIGILCKSGQYFLVYVLVGLFEI